MKKLLLLLTSLIVGGPLLFAQVIPNGDFESWYNHPVFNVEEPESWVTSNLSGAAAGLSANVVKTDDAYAGTYALRLETIMDNDGAPFMGAAVLNAKIEGKPTTLSGYYKGTIVNPDKPGIGIILKTGFMPVGGGELEFTQSQSEYTYFEFEIEYFLNQEPDSIIISIFNDTESLGTQGTVIMLDDLVFDMASGVRWSVLGGVQVKLSPNPVVDQMRVEIPPELGETFFLIYNTQGRLLNSYLILGEKNIPVNFSAGIYYYELRNRPGEILTGGKFLVE